MGLNMSRQYRKWIYGILRLTRNAALAAIIAFSLHALLRGGIRRWIPENTIHQLSPADAVTSLSTVQAAEPQQFLNQSATVWQHMLQDPTLQAFVNLTMPTSSIKNNLDDEKYTCTVYAPINSAFEGPLRHPVEAPIFYWMFLSMNHMGSHNVSYEELKASTTVENYISTDRWQKNRQRISTRSKSGEMLFNHVANYVGRPLQAINGFVHHIDSLLYLPDGASDLLRSDPDLQTFQNGLTDTNVAVAVNDTQSHLTQTVFAPTNQAFENLGSKVNKFLFSPLGKTFLTALMQYHVVLNSTLFTDMYFKPNGSGQLKLNISSEPIQLPTLLPHRDLTAMIVKPHLRQTILLNDEVVVSHPDLIVMDGVIHKIDSVLLPPPIEREEGYEGSHRDSGGVFGSLFAWLWPWSKHTSAIGVEELMERLQPYIADKN